MITIITTQYNAMMMTMITTIGFMTRQITGFQTIADFANCSGSTVVGSGMFWKVINNNDHDDVGDDDDNDDNDHLPMPKNGRHRDCGIWGPTEAKHANHHNHLGNYQNITTSNIKSIISQHQYSYLIWTFPHMIIARHKKH